MKAFNKLAVLAALVILFFIGIAAIKPPVNDEFKNLQVLPKNISADSLDKIMDGFTDMLGVNCKYCHVHDKKADSLIFDKDDKPEKEIARKMMHMVADLNKNYFKFNEAITADEVQAVTCFTCHRGEPMPEKKPEKNNK